MQGLMYRLAELDADSAGLVRVIDYFDALIRHGADTSAMLRASAALADCVVGIDVVGTSGGHRQHARCDPKGRWLTQAAGQRSATKDVVVDDVVMGSVWIERAGPALALDEMLVDRMALTAAIILVPRHSPSAAEHTRAVLFPMDDIALLSSLTALHIEPTTRLRVAIATADSPPTAHAPTAGRSTPITVDNHVLYLLPGEPSAPWVGSGRMGVSLPMPASAIHRHLGNARFALAQAGESEPVVIADRLGALNLLETGNGLAASDIPDLVRVAELRTTTHGIELISTLRTYLGSGSLRATADRMHLHHSSVAHRLAKISEAVGYPVDSIEHRARATAMMMVLDGSGAGDA
ncbi:helix-turn-helix domain-containing protein [Rhodococcoides yunnanense]|uniref:Helix-turn-helix domain-containing protein n=1 Tax=Rhodococcoides yunnanense TaxID=278209 RepID=A0ABU4BCT4_9NOCA|nr:helix-turn-helix domain-containing protein [Rhodococcus yunnanensis]MDV6261990.1 helix-turn-helix domain-containing protein [Rhodococcus yunnanensis]